MCLGALGEDHQFSLGYLSTFSGFEYCLSFENLSNQFLPTWSDFNDLISSLAFCIFSALFSS